MSRIATVMGTNNNKVVGANEDMFLQAFDATPKLELATQKKMEAELSRVVGIISNPNADWGDRMQAMKYFRTLVNSGLLDTEYFHQTLKSLEVPFQNNICDLRSQVVRETCITIAFLSCRLQQKFARMAEILLPSLIKLIPNSAKIVSTSSLVALRFIIQSTHNSRLITIVKYQLSTSKSKEIHRALCELVERIVTLWQPAVLERHINDLQEVIRLGICDSDEQARQNARRAFNVFAEHFREPADRLFNSLDQQRKRMLNNLNHGGGSTLSMNGHHEITSATSSTLSTLSGGGNSSNMASRLKSHMTSNGIATQIPQIQTSSPTTRSASAIDMDAQRRARARAAYMRPTRPIGMTASSVINSFRQTPTRSQANHHPSTPSHHHHTPLASHHSSSISQHQHSQYHTPVASYATPVATSHHNSQLSNNSGHHSLTPSSIPVATTTNHQTPASATGGSQTQPEKRDGVALSKAAAYLTSVITNNIAENQVVTTLKYYNSLIDKHPPEIVSKLLPELMPPLVIGIDNVAISVRKASVFAMVAIHAKVGLKQMEEFLTSLTMTQRKLLEVYIKKHEEENNQGRNNQSA